MHALYLVIVSALVAIIAYRTYGAFLAARVATLDDMRITPAHTQRDGRDYVPTHPLVLFGHHFAAIAGAGPLIGPVLAAQFGYAPGFIWIVAGCCLAGAVHDFVSLWLSTLTVHIAAAWATSLGWARLARAVTAQATNLGAFGVLWVLQHILCDRFLFRSPPAPVESRITPA